MKRKIIITALVFFGMNFCLTAQAKEIQMVLNANTSF